MLFLKLIGSVFSSRKKSKELKLSACALNDILNKACEKVAQNARENKIPHRNMSAREIKELNKIFKKAYIRSQK
mgnify:CR=1 FL=1